MKTIVTYLKTRLSERSFWVGMGLAVTAAAALPSPWNVLSFLAGTAGSLVPDGTVS